MDELYKALQGAWDDLALSEMLDLLVEIADTKLMHGDSARAAEIVALAIHYPMSLTTRERAEMMLDELERSLCPRAVMDARQRALEITLDDLIGELLVHG
jgi:hypothetical protein